MTLLYGNIFQGYSNLTKEGGIHSTCAHESISMCIDYDQFDTLLIDLSHSSLLHNRKSWFEFHSELKLKQNFFKMIKVIQHNYTCIFSFPTVLKIVIQFWKDNYFHESKICLLFHAVGKLNTVIERDIYLSTVVSILSKGFQR